VEVLPLAGLSDSGIAMTGALALFVTPVHAGRRVFALDWESMRALPWGILILFGGGLSLAGAVKANGVAEFLGGLSHHIAGMPTVVIVLGITTMVIFLTELTSNAATTATLLPVLAALAPGMGVHPFLLIMPATVAASCAFMMPVATPPNAIIFASGEVRIAHLARAGIWLNLVGIALITVLALAWFPQVFDLGP
jgi:sodium-dependent dicarboxylate transporter 2/3/5